MDYHCPHCARDSALTDRRTFVRCGHYRRSSDRRIIQRFKCRVCRKTFSRGSFDPCFKQLKRQFNQLIFEHLASGVSQRRLAYLLRLNRKTIKRKFRFLGWQSHMLLNDFNKRFPKAQIVEFDDLETFEHTKCKPLSITLAVEGKTRRILSFSVSRMPAKGLIAKRALKKYGPRPDERAQGRKMMLEQLKDLVEPTALFKSDQSPHYPTDVKRHFPIAQHWTTKGGRGSSGGQGELKKLQFDPIFSLNHTFAKLRADINRLIRKTWCTTKRPDRLRMHVAIMALYHNQHLFLPKRV